MRSVILNIILILTILSCKNKRKVSVEKLDIKFEEEGKLWIMNSQKDTLASFLIETAKSDFERSKGFMNRKKLRDDQAMLFIFEKENNQNFWMKKTYIPLDLIFINKYYKIIHISKDNIPLSLKNIESKYPCKYVLEIYGGMSEKLNIRTGMTVKWEEFDKNLK